jgi:hypothetical protein
MDTNDKANEVQAQIYVAGFRDLAPFCGYSSRAFPLAELVYEHSRNNQHPDCDLQDERIYPQEISSIP